MHEHESPNRVRDHVSFCGGNFVHLFYTKKVVAAVACLDFLPLIIVIALVEWNEWFPIFVSKQWKIQWKIVTTIVITIIQT